MDPTTQIILSATFRLLDLVGRLAEKKADTREELEEYIAERNALRKELMEAARHLGDDSPNDGGDDPHVGVDPGHPAGDDLAHGYHPTQEPENDEAEASTQPE